MENEFVIAKVRRYVHETGILQFWDKHTMGLRTYKVWGPDSSKIVIH